MCRKEKVAAPWSLSGEDSLWGPDFAGWLVATIVEQNPEVVLQWIFVLLLN